MPSTGARVFAARDDQAAGRIEQRLAGVAGVDRGVGLDELFDRAALARDASSVEAHGAITHQRGEVEDTATAVTGQSQHLSLPCMHPCARAPVSRTLRTWIGP
jgi:hypothetical protein